MKKLILLVMLISGVAKAQTFDFSCNTPPVIINVITSTSTYTQEIRSGVFGVPSTYEVRFYASIKFTAYDVETQNIQVGRKTNGASEFHLLYRGGSTTINGILENYFSWGVSLVEGQSVTYEIQAFDGELFSEIETITLEYERPSN